MADAATVARRDHRAGQLRRWSLNAVLLAACAVSLYPFLVMLFGSLKGAGEITTNPGGVPLSPTVDNYLGLFTGETGRLVWRGMANSLIVTIPSTILTVVLAAMADYEAKFG